MLNIFFRGVILFFVLALHVLALFFVTLDDVKIERSGGPQISIVGATVFSKVENKVAQNVESEAAKKSEEKKKPIEKKEPEKPEPPKEKVIEKPKEVAEKPKPVRPEQTELIKKKEVPIKKVEPKKVEPPKKEKLKKVVKKTKPRKRPSRRNSRASTRTGKKVAANQKGGGKSGRQSKVSGNASLTNYKGRLVSHLQRHKFYPENARRQNLRGRAVVRFVIAANGRVLSVRLVRGSGVSVLDRAALSTVRRASPFPPIPNGLKRRMTFVVPIEYFVR